MALPRLRINPATLLSAKSYQVPGKLWVTEQFFSVPLDHSKPDGRKLRLFCRTAEPYENPAAGRSTSESKHLPLLTFINGGPGFGCPHPKSMPATHEILERGYKLVCFDHRGMGLSAPITARTLQREGDARAQADYVTHFRAPSAVQDLEAIRLCLTAEYPEHLKKWSIMGQSYGGYLSTTYLSMYPQGLKEAFLFGGLPPIKARKPDEAIKRLLHKVRERNDSYYSKYADDIPKVKKIVEHLRENSTSLPDGGRLSAERFLEMGINFGGHGGIDDVHNVVLRAYDDLDVLKELTRPTLDEVASIAFDDAILYALLHLPLYCQREKSAWACDRIVGEQSDFGADREREKYLFTGEMVFRRAYDDYSELRELKDVADILEAKEDWTDLYDEEQLKKNEVPTYAAVYVEDMYVEYDLAMDTARTIAGCKTFVTNQMYHSAFRSKSTEVMKAVFSLRNDVLD